MNYAIKINQEIKILSPLPNYLPGVGAGLRSISESELLKVGIKPIIMPVIPQGKQLGILVDSEDNLSFTYTLTDIPQPTAQELLEEALINETHKYIQRQQDGVNAYAKISAEFRLAKLNGQITEAEHSVIESLLRPVRDEVLAGQWITALEILEQLGDAAIGLDLYTKLHTQISNYIAENYEN